MVKTLLILNIKASRTGIELRTGETSTEGCNEIHAGSKDWVFRAAQSYERKKTVKSNIVLESVLDMWTLEQSANNLVFTSRAWFERHRTTITTCCGLL